MLIGLGQLTQQQAPPPQAPRAASSEPEKTLTDAQAEKYANDPRLLTVALWAESPNEAAKLEATALLSALEQLKAEAVPLAQDLQRNRQAKGVAQANLARMRAEIDALSRQGMGEIMALERETGEWVDPFMAGFMSSVRKALKDVDKAVIRPWSQSLNSALKEVDRAAIRPWSSPLNSALKAVDRAVIRPWSSPLNAALKKFDKYTIRPAAREVGKGIVVLDKFVPGWTVLLDFVAPIPLGTILGAIAGKSVVSTVARSFGLPGSGLIGNLVKVGDEGLQEAFSSAQSIAATPIGRTLPLTIAKGTNTFITTKGPFLTKLRATATEAVSGFALVLTLAGTVVTFGSATPAMLAALGALQALNAGLQSGISVLNAQEAAKELKKQSRLIRDAANAELAKIQAEEQATLAEIARLRANIEEVKRRRLLLAKQQADQAAARRRAEAGVVGRTAEELGVSEETLVLGGIAAVGGLILIIAVSGSE